MMRRAAVAACVLLWGPMASAQQEPLPCDADVNGDGRVNVADILATLSAFGSRDAAAVALGDVNGDGAVTVSDILLVLAAFGTAECGDRPAPPGPPAPAPPRTDAGTRPIVSPGPGFAGGRVFGLGDNNDGRLGVGDSGNQHHTPMFAEGFGTDVVAIASGGHQTFALKSDGRVFAAGLNEHGQLGDGTTTDRSTGVAVTGLGTDTVEMARGLFSSMVVRTVAGQIYAWGENEVGETCLGHSNQQNTPALVDALGSDNAALGAGAHHLFVIKSSGSVVGCGRNGGGNLGDGTWEQQRLTPVAIPSLGA